MLEALVGNRTAVCLLLFLRRNQSSFANQFSRELKIPLNMIQKQLQRFEKGGILRSYFSKKKKIYTWNEAYPLLREFKALLRKGALLTQSDLIALRDPADGTSLSPKGRIKLADSLRRQAEVLSSCKRYRPFVASFDSFKDYESWRRKQTHPWLI